MVNGKKVTPFYCGLLRLTVNGAVRILTTFPRILFENKNYRLFTVRINFMNTIETLSSLVLVCENLHSHGQCNF